MKRLALVLSLLASLLLAHPAFAEAAPCQFILGFKTLHDLDPADIGECLDNQAFAENGDALQHTTMGLMAWRKADNWTAFTNGYWTWINGPQGLARRLNTDRFSWEQDGPAAARSGEYVARMLAISNDLAGAASQIGKLIANPQIADPGWWAQLTRLLDVFHAAYQQASQLTPPPALAALHQEVVAALKQYDLAATDFLMGARQLNLVVIQRAVQEMDAGTALLTKASDKLKAAAGS
jgi:hypothetical protein